MSENPNRRRMNNRLTPQDSRISQGTVVPLQILEFSSSESSVVSVIFLGGITIRILNQWDFCSVGIWWFLSDQAKEDRKVWNTKILNLWKD